MKPCGQVPSQAGEEALSQRTSGTPIASHTHPVPEVTQAELGGHPPLHAGAVDPQGMGVRHTHPPAASDPHRSPTGHSPSHAGAETPQARGPATHTQAPVSLVTHCCDALQVPLQAGPEAEQGVCAAAGAPPSAHIPMSHTAVTSAPG